MISVDTLPRDGSGILQGAWRVLHDDADYTGQLGAASFVDGETVAPLAGRQLGVLVAAMGAELWIEPWGADLGGYALPPGVLAEVPPGVLEGIPVCPRRAKVADSSSDRVDKAADAAPDNVRALRPSVRPKRKR